LRRIIAHATTGVWSSYLDGPPTTFVEVQDVYRPQGVKINNKHIEAIVRPMLCRVQITDAGGTVYIVGEQVERSELPEENDPVNAAQKLPAQYENLLLSTSKASLSTASFISAASFQDPPAC
jgi:DNA-directed RNA polymerase subunit beta'